MGKSVMKSRVRIVVLGVLTIAALEMPATAQSLTSRYSKLNFTYVYGAGADSHNDTIIVEDAVLVPSDTETTGYLGSTSGVLPGGTAYSAGIDCDLDQTYSISGPLTAFESITASGQIAASSAISGAGIASLQCTNPGNELLFHFTVSTSVHYGLTGTFSHPNPGVFSGVQLQLFNGFSWDTLETTFFMPNGPLGGTGTMIPGNYRMHSFIGVSTFGNQTATTSYDYTLTIQRAADMNCDNIINGQDIPAFVTALLDAPAYDAQYPDCERLNGDINFDDVVSSADIAPFANCVLNGGCQ